MFGSVSARRELRENIKHWEIGRWTLQKRHALAKPIRFFNLFCGRNELKRYGFMSFCDFDPEIRVPFSNSTK